MKAHDPNYERVSGGHSNLNHKRNTQQCNKKKPLHIFSTKFLQHHRIWIKNLYDLKMKIAPKTRPDIFLFRHIRTIRT